MAVGIVCRRSTKDEAQVSLGRQEALGRQWAEERHPGAEVRVYSDDGISGATMDRPGWNAFCADVRAGLITHVWAYEQSRLTRAGIDTWDEVVVMLWAAGIQELSTHRQGAISVAEGNRLQGRLLSVIDQEERERAKVRILDAHAQLAREGRPVGPAPFGFRQDVDAAGRRTLVPDPDRAPIVADVVAKVARGVPLAQIADELNAAGVPTARGAKQWATQHVRSLASRPSAVGLRAHHGQLTEGTWPAIVDRVVWDRAQLVLGDSRIVIDRSGRTRRVSRRHAAPRRYLLTGGLAVCGSCGGPLVGTTRAQRGGKPRSPIYTCHPSSGFEGACSGVSIGQAGLEDLVTDGVLAVLDSGDLAARLSGIDLERAQLIAELDLVRARARRLAEDFAAGFLTDEAYTSGRDIVGAELRRLELALAGLPSLPVLLGDGAVLDRWEDAPLLARRDVITMFVEVVSVSKAKPGTRRFDPDRVKIAWR